MPIIVLSLRHRGLRLLTENDYSRLLRQDLVDLVRKILAVLILTEDIDEFIADDPPGWRVHRLSGDRDGMWSVSATGNWRITCHEGGG